MTSSVTEAVTTDSVPLHDRGFAYGDGVFETLRIVRGSIPLLPWHERRLLDGCARLGIPVSSAQFHNLLDSLALPEQGILKLVVTRGSGGRGYRLPDDPQPRWRAQHFPLVLPGDSLYRMGGTVGLCELRLATQPALAGIKHLNRLEQVLARREVDQHGWHEGIVCNSRGELVEGVAMNLFWRAGEQWFTPQLTDSGVAGVMRQWLLESWPLAHPVQQVSAPAEVLEQADEAFLCNAVQGVLPIHIFRTARWTPSDDIRTLQGRVNELFR